jgi:hypothetical protein
MYDQKIEETLGKEMKQLQSDISKTQKERDDLRAKSGVLDRAPLIGGLRTNGKALNDTEEKLTRLEKRYAELKAQEQKEWDEFKAQEAKYAEIERNFSEDRIETAKNYLKQNREKGEATYKAYKAAKDRADELTTMITDENKKVTEANNELDQVKKDPLSAYKYDAAQHHQLSAQIASVEDGIETTLRPDLKFWQEKVKERGKNISAWENGIDTKRKSLEKMNGEYTLAEETLARTKTKIDSNAMQLNKNGIAVPLPPDEAVPHLQGMILFQQIMQAQGHPIQQAQPQPKPMGMGGPNG